MSSLRLFTPMHTLHAFSRLNTFQREMDRSIGLPPHQHETTSLDNWSPALDLYQDKDRFFVKVELPGMKKEDITLSLHNNLLTVTGERRPDETQSDKGSLRTERLFGRFERTLTMPIQVDGTRVAASYENGILTITLPKAEAAKPRQIEIGVK